MLAFCGIDRCLLDANGRLKFSPRVLEDFARCGSEVVLHCLPEGAIAVYPEEFYRQMRSAEPNPAEKVSQSMLYRSSLRRFGAWSRSEKISAQGRITIPQEYREQAGLKNGAVVVVGVEVGVEIWDRERWMEEQRTGMEHAREKGEREMASDLMVQEQKN
ncbi:MAG: cell division protein MraZ [Lentisphaerae bacterium ADurb.Bin242]|nr:MAG: cell division protein MraZ [Lentisphaerae bacterium ADurb.Bin242]